MAKVIIGLSGGVDSSVAAYLLQQQGHQVEALFMKNWEEDDTDSYCAASADLKDAEEICAKLGIKFHTVNFAQDYWDNVFSYFLEEYKNGRTPNPDILCNKEVKFKCFLNYAINNLHADYIATGHYARLQHDSLTDTYKLLKALDHNKDQSYFLYALNQQQLSKSIFPIGDINKPEVRSIAKQLGLITHDKKDSTGICFIGERKFKEFLSKYLPARPGNMIDQNNKIIGKHDGLMYYTIGQRQGLNLGGLKNYPEQPWYVAGKNLHDNTLLVVQGTDNPLLYSNNIELINPHFIYQKTWEQLQQNSFLDITAKARYRQTDQLARLHLVNNNQFIMEFTESQRAIAPGQAMVFYNNDLCLGGATIK
jgi:tRNA-specific 2-thiouridylase